MFHLGLTFYAFMNRTGISFDLRHILNIIKEKAAMGGRAPSRAPGRLFWVQFSPPPVLNPLVGLRVKTTKQN